MPMAVILGTALGGEAGLAPLGEQRVAGKVRHVSSPINAKSEENAKKIDSASASTPALHRTMRGPLELLGCPEGITGRICPGCWILELSAPNYAGWCAVSAATQQTTTSAHFCPAAPTRQEWWNVQRAGSIGMRIEAEGFEIDGCEGALDGPHAAQLA